MLKNLSAKCISQEMQFRSLGWEGPLKECVAMHYQHTYMENPMGRRAWRARVHRVTKSWTLLKQLSTHGYIVGGRKYRSSVYNL